MLRVIADAGVAGNNQVVELVHTLQPGRHRLVADIGVGLAPGDLLQGAQGVLDQQQPDAGVAALDLGYRDVSILHGHGVTGKVFGALQVLVVVPGHDDLTHIEERGGVDEPPGALSAVGDRGANLELAPRNLCQHLLEGGARLGHETHPEALAEQAQIVGGNADMPALFVGEVDRRPVAVNPDGDLAVLAQPCLLRRSQIDRGSAAIVVTYPAVQDALPFLAGYIVQGFLLLMAIYSDPPMANNFDPPIGAFRAMWPYPFRRFLTRATGGTFEGVGCDSQDQGTTQRGSRTEHPVDRPRAGHLPQYRPQVPAHGRGRHRRAAGEPDPAQAAG